MTPDSVKDPVARLTSSVPSSLSRRAIRFEIFDCTVPSDFGGVGKCAVVSDADQGLKLANLHISSIDGKYLTYSLERYSHGRHTY